LITTEHLENRLWFKDEEDFKAGMNFIAIIAYALNVEVVAFILMSNHVHVILYCTLEEAQKFIELFKTYYSQYYSKRYEPVELLRNNGVDIRQLLVEDESLEKGIAYVHMNSVAANICSTPFNYPWGTGNCFFNPSKHKGAFAKDKSKRELIRLTHSRKSLPANAIFDDSGFVLPESYINVKRIESIFRTPKRMNYFLNSSSKAKITSQGLPSFRDQVIISAIPDLCRSLFQKNACSDLTPQELCNLAKQIRYRFSADPHQISRVIGLSYDSVTELLESF